MELINEHYEGFDIEKDEKLLRYYFEYDVNEADFFLKLNNYWYAIEDQRVHWFTIDIGGHLVRLPENLFIMLADVYGEYVDWIRVSELPGREMCTALYFKELYADQWSIEEIRVVSMDEAPSRVRLPSTKNILPVKVGENRMVFVSEKDSYVKTKKMNFACLY